MNNLKFKIESWLAWKHPLFHSKLYDFRLWWEEAHWKMFDRLNRQCCRYNTIKHCAEKLAVNPKKAVCWGYIPTECPDCHRTIPKFILREAMNMALFVEHYEDAKEEYAKFIKQQNKKRGTTK